MKLTNAIDNSMGKMGISSSTIITIDVALLAHELKVDGWPLRCNAVDKVIVQQLITVSEKPLNLGLFLDCGYVCMTKC